MLNHTPVWGWVLPRGHSNQSSGQLQAADLDLSPQRLTHKNWGVFFVKVKKRLSFRLIM